MTGMRIMQPRPRLSIVMPVWNESERIVAALAAMRDLREQGVEVIVVDGGSSDDTIALARPLADFVMNADRGRAHQMNAGARVASAEALLFLHADTALPERGGELIIEGLSRPGHVWGRFDVRIEGRSPLLKLVARAMNLRSRWTGIATGDQAMFVKRKDFFAVGGFPPQLLMEDIELSSRLKARSMPLCLHERVTTSGRRWDTHGVWRTIFLMWRLRFMYWIGTPADQLARTWR